MKNAVITAKLPSGKWECVHIGENITEAKAVYKKIIADEMIEETAKGYLQYNLFFTPQQRRVSKAGRISEAELKEKAKVQAKKAKEVQKKLEDQAKKQEEAEAKKAEAAKKRAATIKAKQEKEKKEQLERKAADAKAAAEKEAKKAADQADAIAARLAAKSKRAK